MITICVFSEVAKMYCHLRRKDSHAIFSLVLAGALLKRRNNFECNCLAGGINCASHDNKKIYVLSTFRNSWISL